LLFLWHQRHLLLATLYQHRDDIRRVSGLATKHARQRGSASNHMAIKHQNCVFAWSKSKKQKKTDKPIMSSTDAKLVAPALNCLATILILHSVQSG
jgi:hypothetical protein